MSRPAVHLLLLTLLVAGCEDPHSDMGQQDKFQTYEAVGFFCRRRQRPAVAGWRGASTIPTAATMHQRRATSFRLVQRFRSR